MTPRAHAEGSTHGAQDRLMGFDEYCAVVGLGEYQHLERRYAE